MENKSKKRGAPRTSARQDSNKKAKTTKSSTPNSDRIQSPGLALSNSHSSNTPIPLETQPLGLPSTLQPGQHLPTTGIPQQSNYPPQQWQSLEESGVMAESIERSRTRWMSEGLFQRYWTKPYKKKGVIYEPEGNPAKELMSKHGNCTIYIEPHIFEVILYTVKDTTTKLPFQYPQQPIERPQMQYGPPRDWPAIKSDTLTKPISPLPRPQTTSTSSTTPLPTTTPAVPATPGVQQADKLGQVQPAPRPLTASNPAAPPYNPNRPPVNGTHAAPPNKSSDPVIQMLAERAATNADLKGLMRIVADGKATPEQLKDFQRHIDELTRILQTRQAAASPAVTQPPSQAVRNAVIPGKLPASQPYYQSPAVQPQALRSRAPPPPRSDLAAVCFEFVGGSGDRFLFPKHSILDFHNAYRCIASFLIVRKGTAENAAYDPTIDYYQPVTIRVEAPAQQPRMLEVLKAVVAPQEEVRKYMNEIMDNATRAEYVLLAMQLPREGEEASAAPTKKDDSIAKDTQPNDNNVVLWTNITKTNTSKLKDIRFNPPMTEEEARINYIKSVAQ